MVTQLDLIEEEIKKLKAHLVEIDPVPDALMREALSQLITLHEIYMEINKGYNYELLKQAR